MPPITLLMGPVIWEGKQELEKREKLSGENTFSLLLFFVIVNGIIQSLELELLSQVQTAITDSYKTLDDSWFIRLTISLEKKKNQQKLRSTKS